MAVRQGCHLSLFDPVFFSAFIPEADARQGEVQRGREFHNGAVCLRRPASLETVPTSSILQMTLVLAWMFQHVFR
jgi:hypothetical protein